MSAQAGQWNTKDLAGAVTPLPRRGAGGEVSCCPLDFGPAVYMARAALIAVEGLPKNYIHECEMVPPAVQGKPHLTGNDRFFLLYPSPAMDHFTVEYALEKEEKAILNLTTLQGVQILSSQLPSEVGLRNVNVTQVAAGTYIISVMVNGQVKFAQPLSISK